jgi:hypothetical protein
MVIAGFCILVAGVFIWRRDFNTAFIIAIAGVIAWFMNYRIQMKGISAIADEERDRSVEKDDEQDSID